VIDEDGDPIQNVGVVLYYSTAPIQENVGWYYRGDIGFTNEAGYVGFPMGGGAYYFPQHGERGPHAVWLVGDGMSEMVDGLGMLGQSHYQHVDVVYQRWPSGAPPGPDPDPDPPISDTCCEKIQGLMKEIVVELRRLAGDPPPP
jgi:hypothetical protein